MPELGGLFKDTMSIPALFTDGTTEAQRGTRSIGYVREELGLEGGCSELICFHGRPTSFMGTVML